MVCHGELARLRPSPRHLTGYYLTISAGGALGGLLVGIVAPLVLNNFLELHIGLWACALLGLVLLFTDESSPLYRGRMIPLWIALVAGLTGQTITLWVVGNGGAPPNSVAVWRSRDFYGVLTVYDRDREHASTRSLLLQHGGVSHGMQYVFGEWRRMPTSYYVPDSGIGRAMMATAARAAAEGRAGRRIGVVGEGAGSIITWAKRGDEVRFYEINPTVERLARDRFTYLRDTEARAEVVLGDGRLSLERELAQGRPQAFDLLVLDAFSGDAVPTHLLTREAFELYRQHMRAGGVIAVNITNHYLNLQPVIARLALSLGWTTMYVPSNGQGPEPYPSDWVLMTNDRKFFAGEHFARIGIRKARLASGVSLWTDEYSNMFRILR
jgi:hypothetical protein